MENKWDHKEEWRRFGKNFCVVVSRHEAGADDWTGPHRWCVYAYIYPEHPHFEKFTHNSMYQDATACMPLHSGCSFFQRHIAEHAGVTRITSLQVGADYNHLDDNRFTFFSTKDQAVDVFRDADELFDWMTEVGNGNRKQSKQGEP